MYNNMHIRSLRQAVGQINKGMAVFKEYCTERCNECPLTNLCDWEHLIYTDDARLTDEKLEEFVEFHKEDEDSARKEDEAVAHYYGIPGKVIRI